MNRESSLRNNINTAYQYGTNIQPRASRKLKWFREEELDGSFHVTIVRTVCLICSIAWAGRLCNVAEQFLVLLFYSSSYYYSTHSSPKNLSSDCRSSVGRQTANSRPTNGQQSADKRPTVGRQTANSRSTNGQQSVDKRPTVGRQTANSRPTVSAILRKNCRSTVGRLSVTCRLPVGYLSVSWNQASPNIVREETLFSSAMFHVFLFSPNPPIILKSRYNSIIALSAWVWSIKQEVPV